MTESSKPPELLSDAEMERLLSVIGTGAGSNFDGRDAVRKRMLQAFERADGLGLVDSTDGRERSSDGGDVTELVDYQKATVGSVEPVARRWSIAASILIVVGLGAGLAAWHGQRQDNDTASDVVGTDTIPVMSEVAPQPAGLPSLVFHTDLVGGGIELDLIEGVEVLDEREGRLVLGLVADQNEPRSIVTVMDVSAGRGVASQLADPETDSMLVALASVGVAGGEIVPEYELRLANEASVVHDCQTAGPCLPFGDVELWSQASNVVTEFEGPDGQVLWWVEQAATRHDPLLGLATEMLRTLRFD